MNRRRFLHRALMATGAAMAGPLQALARQQPADVAEPTQVGYGPLVPVRDDATGLRLLSLPQGFHYTTFGYADDLLIGGRRTPALHDGMGAIGGPNGRVYLVRNHEVGVGAAFDLPAYDAGAGGGTTTLEFDGINGRLVAGRVSLAGTLRNCAGGVTPWGTWLTCEEAIDGPTAGSGLGRPHGYVFEVPAVGRSNAQPLTAMGRFVHEAVAVDPAAGVVYLTEDAEIAGLYRFVPRVPGLLAAGGRLEMLGIDRRGGYDTRRGQRLDDRMPIAWVPIEDVSRPNDVVGGSDGSGVFRQGYRNGGATFGRLEGCSIGGGSVYVTATSAGNAGRGQVWEIDPRAGSLRLVFESPGGASVNMPDNLAMSPRGGLVMCEDGAANPSVYGITADGQLFRFLRNTAVFAGQPNGLRGDFRFSELTGPTFSPDGRWLFLNMQKPGFTIAITGPWRDGAI